MSPPNKLRLNPDGVLYCIDGADLTTYLAQYYAELHPRKASITATDIPVNLIAHDDFLRLLELRFQNYSA